MKSKEMKYSFALILGIDVFSIYASISAHAIPFWGIAIMANIIGLFFGFYLGFITKLYEDKNTSHKS